jgi:hypothetical protein
VNTETPTSPFDTYPCDKDGPCPQHLQQAAYLAADNEFQTSVEAKLSVHAAQTANADWVAPAR